MGHPLDNRKVQLELEKTIIEFTLDGIAEFWKKQQKKQQEDDKLPWNHRRFNASYINSIAPKGNVVELKQRLEVINRELEDLDG